MACLKEYLPLLAMIIVEVNYTWTNIFSKAALNSGMTPYVLIAYRQIFGTLAIAPFAFFLERNITRPAMTRKIMLQTMFCSVFGGALTTLLYYIGLKYTSATVASAAENTLPVLTYIIGVIARLEKLSVNDRKGHAKLFGTFVTVGGALLLSFYTGPVLNIPRSKIEWRFVEVVHGTGMSNKQTILGPLLIFSSCFCAALWMMVQTKLSQSYPVPFTNTFLMCFFSVFPTTVVSLSLNHKLSEWSLKSPIRLVAALCSGIASSAVGFLLMSFAAGEKGPLYVSIFSPLLLVMVAFLSWALLGEQLVVGTLVGSVLIVVGLYTVLWGKNKELEEARGRPLNEERR